MQGQDFKQIIQKGWTKLGSINQEERKRKNNSTSAVIKIREPNTPTN